MHVGFMNHERESTLAFLKKMLKEHQDDSPTATGGLPSAAHVDHWARRDTIASIIGAIQSGKHVHYTGDSNEHTPT